MPHSVRPNQQTANLLRSLTTRKDDHPDDFILGAAASAWQTEGWSGKKGQDSWPDLWYKNDRHVWHNGYGPAVATDFINRFRKTCS
jgi:beta-glucosidase